MKNEIDEFTNAILSNENADYEIMDDATKVIDTLSDILRLESDENQQEIVSAMHFLVNQMVSPEDPTVRKDLAMKFSELQQILRGNEIVLLQETVDLLENTKGVFKRADVKGEIKARKKVINLADELEKASGLFIERYSDEEDELGK